LAKPASIERWSPVGLSGILSVIALSVSIGSLGVTVWATRISKKSLKRARDVQDRSDRREFEGIRSEILNQVSDSRAVLDKTRVEIGTLRAEFDAEPTAVQASMASYTTLFSEYLPNIERAVHQCDSLWSEVSAWNNDKSDAELMRARALLYRSLKDDESAHESGVYMVNVFKTKLELARRLRSTRGAGQTQD
jgi:hypothetical protein